MAQMIVAGIQVPMAFEHWKKKRKKNNHLFAVHKEFENIQVNWNETVRNKRTELVRL